MVWRQTDGIECGDLRRALVDRSKHRVEDDQGGDRQWHPDATLRTHRMVLGGIHHPQPTIETSEEIVVDAVSEAFELVTSPGKERRHRSEARISSHAGHHRRRQHEDLAGR